MSENSADGWIGSEGVLTSVCRYCKYEQKSESYRNRVCQERARVTLKYRVLREYRYHNCAHILIIGLMLVVNKLTKSQK